MAHHSFRNNAVTTQNAEVKVRLCCGEHGTEEIDSKSILNFNVALNAYSASFLTIDCRMADRPNDSRWVSQSRGSACQWCLQDLHTSGETGVHCQAAGLSYIGRALQSVLRRSKCFFAEPPSWLHGGFRVNGHSTSTKFTSDPESAQKCAHYSFSEDDIEIRENIYPLK